MIRSGETPQDAASEVALAMVDVIRSVNEDMEHALTALRAAYLTIDLLKAEVMELRYALEAARRVQ